MNTLRKRAQAWLDAYERGGIVVNEFSFEDWATIIAEYLQDTKADVEAEYRMRELESQVKKLEIKLDAAERRTVYLEGENAALRFSVRCNGVSGAEVTT